MTVFNDFTSNKTPCGLSLTKTHLVVTDHGKRPKKLFGASNISRNIPFNEILCVNTTSSVQSSDQHSRESCCFLNIFITRKKNFKWRLSKIVFNSSDANTCEKFKDDIQHAMQVNDDFLMRPKSLLVFVNPYGGHRKAKEIYEDKVKPLFDLTHVKTHVVVTEYRTHAKNFIESNDISTYDGIIAVGGDGMLNEIINGILLKVQKANSITVDADDPNNPPKYLSPDIRLGVIPAGSTDCVSYTTQGINDPITSALHILVGDSHPIDICSVHDKNGHLHQFYASTTSYGFFGDVLKRSEEFRWMGPPRYDYAGFQIYLKNKSYPGQIRYVKSEADISQSPACRSPCGVCQHGWDEHGSITPKVSSSSLFLPSPMTGSEETSSSSDSSSRSEDAGLAIKIDDENTSSQSDSIELNVEQDCINLRPDTLQLKAIEISKAEEKWETTSGQYTFINAIATSCACETTPLGLSPNSHLSDGSLDLIMVEKCSHKQLLQYLLAHKGSGDRFRFPFVKAVRVKSFQFMLLPKQDEVKTPTDEATTGFIGRLRRSFSTSNASEANTSRNRGLTFSTSTQAIREEKCDDDSALSIWNSDGEMITDPEITVHCHRGLIKMFCRGIEKPVKN